MGGLPIPNEKDRQRIVENRKRYELNRAARLRLNQSSAASASEASSVPPKIEVEVVQSGSGILVVKYEKDGVLHMGIMLAENGVNGAPGIIRDDMAKFQERLNSFTNTPIIDQWTSVVCERFATSGMHLRDQTYMRSSGRMVCAACMQAIPKNEIITRKRCTNASQRKRSVPQGTRRVAAQVSRSKRSISDEVGYESMDERLNGETADYSSDASTGSVPLQKRNKRKAYTPHGACSVLVPAGVDLFEPEYNPLPGPSSGTRKRSCSGRPANKVAKRCRSLLTSDAGNCTADSTVAANNDGTSGKNKVFGRSRNAEPAAVKEIKEAKKEEGAQNAAKANAAKANAAKANAAGPVRLFKSEKIRKAFNPEYSIRKAESDSLHMTFVRQPNEQQNAGEVTAKPNTSSMLGAPTHGVQSAPVVDSCPPPSPIKAQSATNEAVDACHPPIKIVLKSVKKCDMGVQHQPPVRTDADVSGQPPRRSLSRFRYPPAIEKVLLENSAMPPQRRSDTGCPPMVKATAAVLEMGTDLKNAIIGSGAALLGKNNKNFKIGEIVWAKNKTDPYWPGQIYKLVKSCKKEGATVFWYGATTYSPFIEFTQIEKFVDSYTKRYNPQRQDAKYHRAVGSAIVACLPRRGYFEQKMSPQLHRFLMNEQKLDLSDVKLRSKRKKAASSAASKRRSTVPKTKMQLKIPKAEPSDAETANGNESGAPQCSSDVDPSKVINHSPPSSFYSASGPGAILESNEFATDCDTPPLVIATDCDEH